MSPLMRLLGILLFLLITLQSTFAQYVTVLDGKSGETVDHVALYNQDKSISTLTDNYGKANILDFADGDSIYFQHPSFELAGYLKHELVFGTSRVMLVQRNIMMKVFVVSATKSLESKGETPFMINVLDAEQLSTNPSQTGADILQSTGNVMIQKSQGGGGSPILRGFEANKILLVVDGVRMNNAIYRSGHLQNAITIDNNILDRVEVLFGPSSIIYGSDALGGVIHYYTRVPELNKTQIGLYTEYSTANRGKIVHADLSIGGKKFANLTSFTFKDFGDTRSGKNRPEKIGDWGLLNHYVGQSGGMDTTLANPDPYIQKNSGYLQYDVFSKTRFTPSHHLDVNLNLQLSTSSDIDRFDELNDYDGDNLKYAEYYYGPQTRILTSVQGVFKNYNPIYTNATATLAFQRISEDRITRKFRADEKLFQEEDVFVYSGNFDFMKVMKESQRLYYGLEITHNDVNSNARYEDIRNGNITSALTRYPGGGSHTNSFSLYGNYKLIPSEQMVLNAGLRYYYGTLRSEFTDPNLPYDEIRINNGALTGSLSLVYKPVESWQYDFILATGFRNPNVDDYGKVRAKGDFVTVPNQDLKPEYTYNLEIGISKKITGIAVFSGSVFFTYLKNAIVRADYTINGSDSLLYDGDYYKIITSSNATLATIQGTSLSIHSDLPGKFQFMGTFNYLKGNDITNNVPLGHIPPVFGRASVSYLLKNFTNEFFIHYSGWKYWSEMTPFGEDNETEAIEGEGFPSWYTINLRSHYRINDNFEAQITIENLLDKFYKTFASGIGAPGRNFIFTLRVRF